MQILNEIIANKRLEIAQRKRAVSILTLEQQIGKSLSKRSLKQILIEGNGSGMIAEFKRSSPSRGLFPNQYSLDEIVEGYVDAGASALSVLTDAKYFGAHATDLPLARLKAPETPILRKEFIVDQYQITEAKVIGADLILLIASVLTVPETEEFTRYAHDIGLEVLLEVHTKKELHEYIGTTPDILGINNRNLDTLKTDVETSFALKSEVPEDVVCISESGIDNPETIRQLRSAGFKGFLIGDAFLREPSPMDACKKLINEVLS